MGPIPTAVGMALLEEADEADKSSREAAREKERAANPPKEYSVYQSKRRKPPPITTTTPGGMNGNGEPARRTPARSASVMSSMSTASTSTSEAAFIGHEAIVSAHETLQRRIAPFWSSILPNRRVLVDIYATPPGSPLPASSSPDTTTPSGPAHSPIRETDPDPDPDPTGSATPATSFQILTDANGHFSKVVTIPWETLCTTPSTVAMAFSTNEAEKLGWDIRVRTRLDYEVFDQSDQGGYRERIRRAMATYGVDATDGPGSGTGQGRDQARSVRQVGGEGSGAAGVRGGPGAEGGGEGEVEDVNRGMKGLSLNTPGEPQVVVNTTVRLGSAGGVHIISDLVSLLHNLQVGDDGALSTSNWCPHGR